MTKRNAHALQRRYTKLLARATALTSAAWHFGQGVTGRPPWSLGLGMLGPHRFPARNVPAEPQTIRAKLRAVGAGCKAEVVGSDPFRQPSRHSSTLPLTTNPDVRSGSRSCGLRGRSFVRPTVVRTCSTLSAAWRSELHCHRLSRSSGAPRRTPAVATCRGLSRKTSSICTENAAAQSECVLQVEEAARNDQPILKLAREAPHERRQTGDG